MWIERLGLVLALCSGVALAQDVPDGFRAWVQGLRPTALQQGISAATFDATLGNVAPVPRVLELDARQPEFVQTFLDYLERRVTPNVVAQGQRALAENAALFAAVEARYPVPRAVLAAFWGLETGYGAHLGDFPVPAALATLAYQGRRTGFFRDELIAALKIVDAGHVDAGALRGSWAGAMGQMQFMPSTFGAYAVDGDNDGRTDLWRSLADALHSAANYLTRIGWRAGEPIAVEVVLPEGFDLRRSGARVRLPVATWSELGVRPASGGALPTVSGRAALLLPQGHRGPAFLTFDNFDVVLRWNRSVNYALAVAHLAARLEGGAPLVGGRDAEREALSAERLRALQGALTALGFDAGPADGLPGPRTELAVRLFQITHGLPADGYASPSLAARVESAFSAAKAAGRLACAPLAASGTGCD
jgi:membrane-bound lytic murein transglycosylase B